GPADDEGGPPEGGDQLLRPPEPVRLLEKQPGPRTGLEDDDPAPTGPEPVEERRHLRSALHLRFPDGRGPDRYPAVALDQSDQIVAVPGLEQSDPGAVQAAPGITPRHAALR